VRAVVAARARREDDALAALIGDVFRGGMRRELPEPVLRTLETLDLARRGEPVGV
jgi:hypothetical protein